MPEKAGFLLRFKNPDSTVTVAAATAAFANGFAALIGKPVTPLLRLMYEYLSPAVMAWGFAYLPFAGRHLNGRADVGLILLADEVATFLEELIFLEMRGDGENDLRCLLRLL